MTSGPSRVVRPESIAVWDAFPVGYPAFVADVKARIATARTRAALAVNSELILLYWEIGREILTRQSDEG